MSTNKDKYSDPATLQQLTESFTSVLSVDWGQQTKRELTDLLRVLDFAAHIFPELVGEQLISSREILVDMLNEVSEIVASVRDIKEDPELKKKLILMSVETNETQQ